MASYNASSFNSLDWDEILIVDDAHDENKTLIISTTEFKATQSTNLSIITTFFRAFYNKYSAAL